MICTRPKTRRRYRRSISWDDKVRLAQRLWEDVDKTPGLGPDGECWEWIAGKNGVGYGMFRVDGKVILAHRVAYELYCGPVPKGKIVRHRCDNPPCCNPSHVLLGTVQDNVDDRVRRNRSAQGERVSGAKLTEAVIPIIRSDPRPQTQIAADYGVSQQHISRIKTGAKWGHV